MKKILSVLLTAAMLLSLVIVASVPAAAVDGEWAVYASSQQRDPAFDDDKKSVPGYEYTDDGFTTIPGDWSTSSPFGVIQTKEKVDLKDGVYMEIRVDDFTYAGDKWYNINIWDSVSLTPGNADEIHGRGIQNLIRPATDTGVISGASWYYEGFQSAGSTSFGSAAEEGEPITMILTVTWDGTAYTCSINGVAAPQAINDYMTTKWGGADSSAYIGFAFHCSTVGGTAKFTVTKFGTSAEDAVTPAGDDSAEPENYDNTVADLMDASEIPDNTPAIFLNANTEESDIKARPTSSAGGLLTINDDYSMHIVAHNTGVDCGTYKVKNDISYSLADFPVAITLTKNFCTCGDTEECYALEEAAYYICSGAIVAPDPLYQTTSLDMSYNSYTIGDDTYLYFFNDYSENAPAALTDLNGRINGIRFDIAGADLSTPGANAWDIMFTAFFRTTEEAEAFVIDYVTKLGWVDPEAETDAPETDAPETDAPETDAPETDAPETDAPETDAPETDAPETNAPVAGTDDPTTGGDEEGGCASVVGFGAIAVVAAIAACGIVSFKKKED